MVIILSGIFDVYFKEKPNMSLVYEQTNNNHFKLKILDTNVEIFINEQNLEVKIDNELNLSSFYLLLCEIMGNLNLKKIIFYVLKNNYSTHRALLYVGFVYDNEKKVYILNTS